MKARLDGESLTQPPEEFDGLVDPEEDKMTMEELDKELEDLMKKLDNEKSAIDELRSLKENRRNMKDVIAHARRGDSAALDAGFFITSLDTGELNDEPKKVKPRQLYPNLEKEQKLAREEKKTTTRLSRLKVQSSSLKSESLQGPHRQMSNTKIAASATTAKRKTLRNGGIVGGARRLSPIPGLVS